MPTKQTGEKKRKHGGGMPAHVPTDSKRREVVLMSGVGIPDADIARELGISEKTLRKYYRKEMDEGDSKARMQLLNTAFKMATSGRSASMTKFLLNVRYGIKEVFKVESDDPLVAAVVPVKIYLPDNGRN